MPNPCEKHEAIAAEKNGAGFICVYCENERLKAQQDTINSIAVHQQALLIEKLEAENATLKRALNEIRNRQPKQALWTELEEALR